MNITESSQQLHIFLTSRLLRLNWLKLEVSPVPVWDSWLLGYKLWCSAEEGGREEGGRESVLKWPGATGSGCAAVSGWRSESVRVSHHQCYLTRVISSSPSNYPSQIRIINQVKTGDRSSIKTSRHRYNSQLVHKTYQYLVLGYQ